MRAAALLGVCLLILGAASIAAAEPSAQDVEAEIPAPVYVTLLLARDAQVHGELGLSRAQAAAVQKAVTKVDGPLWLLRDVPVDKCREEHERHRTALRSAMAAVLSAEQMARFDQLVVQARGAKALVAPDVRERLRLNDEQLGRFKHLVAETKDGNLDAKAVMELLSPDQQTQLAGLFGKRFDLNKVTYVGCGQAPELRNVDTWINSEPLSLGQLKGKVVAVHFWAFGCINCVHNLPHYQAWHEKFPRNGLTIVGIHTPETSAERDVDNLRASVQQRGIAYPVAFDAKADNWKAWGNNVWPAVYLVDRRGRVRYWWYGELNWQGARGEEAARARIEQLLAEK